MLRVMGEIIRKRLQQSHFEGPVHEALLNLMVAAAFVRDAFHRALEKHGMTQGQYNVLRILKGALLEGYARGTIAQRLIDRAPDVTRLIDRLEERGLVERVRSTRDRRLSVTRITPRGIELVERMQPSMEKVQHAFGGRFKNGEAQELSRLCELLYADQDDAL
jgi:DNA-binding MarR family transcriptional regulator